jgi:hypothetical protein
MPLIRQTLEQEHASSRYDDLTAKFYVARANFHKSQNELHDLQEVVRIKQEVLEELLPYYPHPLSSSMQAKVDLT